MTDDERVVDLDALQRERYDPDALLREHPTVHGRDERATFVPWWTGPDDEQRTRVRRAYLEQIR